MPYAYAVYNVQDSKHSGATNDAIAAMEADGWRPHTVNCNFAELCIFWEKPLPEDRSGKPRAHGSSQGSSASSTAQAGAAS